MLKHVLAIISSIVVVTAVVSDSWSGSFVYTDSDGVVEQNYYNVRKLRQEKEILKENKRIENRETRSLEREIQRQNREMDKRYERKLKDQRKKRGW